MDQDQHIVEASRRLTEALRPGDLDATLARLTQAAVDVLPDVEHASMTIRHADGRLETVAPTSPFIADLDAAQYTLREGPCYEAATESVHVTAPHMASDPRFPHYAREAVSRGVEAQAGIRLFDTTASSGALNLYAVTPGAFEDLGSIGALFTHHAAVALAYAREVTQLQEAVRTRQLIGRAVGVTMERFGLDEARAFGFLTRLSQDTNTKLKVVAERLLDETAGSPPHQS